MTGDLNKKVKKVAEIKALYYKTMIKVEEKLIEYQRELNDLNIDISTETKEYINRRLEEAKINVVNCISNQIGVILLPYTETHIYDTKRRPKRFSKKVVDILEESFLKDKYPGNSEKNKLANLCLITSKQVNNWFTNKRNRAKNLHETREFYRKE
ncbi:HD1 [Hepatospora eriocheir]|uniref:HD1 n=1 Tax=Hepatospora eriocheir TaxID=1081669 RepID=A0A1X0QCZ0_9MICR|nr:HD1 [Hepatospora eriocheir]